jgi:hypothetical protein
MAVVAAPQFSHNVPGTAVPKLKSHWDSVTVNAMNHVAIFGEFYQLHVLPIRQNSTPRLLQKTV